MSNRTIVTSTAIIEVRSPDIRLMRYLPGVLVDTAAIQENIRADATLPPARAIILMIPEGTRFAMDMLENDQTADGSPMRLLALVVLDPMFLLAADLYFAYHPPNYRFRVFEDMAAAEAWVEAGLAEGMA